MKSILIILGLMFAITASGAPKFQMFNFEGGKELFIIEQDGITVHLMQRYQAIKFKYIRIDTIERFEEGNKHKLKWRRTAHILDCKGNHSFLGVSWQPEGSKKVLRQLIKTPLQKLPEGSVMQIVEQAACAQWSPGIPI